MNSFKDIVQAIDYLDKLLNEPKFIEVNSNNHNMVDNQTVGFEESSSDKFTQVINRYIESSLDGSIVFIAHILK
jgi:hypothetical protein